MSKDLMKLADVSMYDAAAMPKEEGERVKPKVYLVSATPDPLGAIACGQRLFAGKPTYSLNEVTNEERKWAWEECMRSHLKAPLEMVDLHFFIEGVTRAFTHQMVRQRTAVYVQESLRFAVKGDLQGEVAVPPSLSNLPDDHPLMKAYMHAVREAEDAYDRLIADGVPAEDARGLLPHCTTTRLFYKTNLRNLLDHAGNRLCTQAQFEWRVVFAGIMRAIKNYVPANSDHAWQFELIGQPTPQTFAPACYQHGKCVFKGQLDRHCKIRERVDQNEALGRPPEHWSRPGAVEVSLGNVVDVDAIHPAEWMMDHTSARRQRDVNEVHSHEADVPCFPACPMWGVTDA